MTDLFPKRDGPARVETAASLFAGPGEMRALCRAFDWSTTSLGAVDTWSSARCNTVRTVMAARCPAFLWLGPDLVQIFNDAYRPSLGEGGRHAQAVGAKGAQFWAEIWPIIGPQIAQVLAGGEATWNEDQLVPITRNGQVEDVYWTYGYSAVFDEDGSVGGVLVLCQETTARVIAEREQLRLAEETARAEQRAARILDQVSDEHLTMDADFRILTLNDAAERNLGVPRETFIGLTHWEAFPASVGSIAETHYRRAMAEREEIHFAHRYVGEGYDRHLEIDVYPTDDGGLAVFWRDTTARVQAQAERERLFAAGEEARRAAEAANRAKSEFLAVMSHELRTPLNAIGGYTELLELGIHGPVTEPQRATLARIQASQRHLLGLIAGVLDLSRVEAGAVTYRLEDIPVTEAVGEAEVLVAPQLRAKLSLPRA